MHMASPITLAAMHGETDLLLAYLRDATPGNDALRWACYTGAIHAVRILLADGRANPADGAVGWARAGGDDDVVRLLLTDRRVNIGLENRALLGHLVVTHQARMRRLLQLRVSAWSWCVQGTNFCHCGL